MFLQRIRDEDFTHLEDIRRMKKLECERRNTGVAKICALAFGFRTHKTVYIGRTNRSKNKLTSNMKTG